MARAKAAMAMLVMGLLLCSPAWAQSDSKVRMVALGQAPTGANQVQARDQAVDRALQQAVGRLAAELVDPATLRTRLGILAAKILATAPQFVSSYDLTATVQNKDQTLVLVTAMVDKEALLKALDAAGLRLPAGGLPVTLVLVAEEAAPGRPASYWWSGAVKEPAIPAAIATVLQSLGVKTVDPATLVSQVPPEARQQVLSEEQALKLARLAGAGLVIMGRVRTYPVAAPQGSQAGPVAQLMAIDAAKASVITVVEEDGPTFEQTPGPEAGAQVVSAVEAAVRRLLEKVVATRRPVAGAEDQGVIIEVSGVRRLADLHRFEEVLGSLHAMVESLQRESVAPGVVTLRLKLKAPAATLADQLLLQEYGSFLVNVTQSTAELIKVVLIPKR